MVSAQAGSFVQSFTPIAITGVLFEFDLNQQGTVYYGVTATLSGSEISYSQGVDTTQADFALARYLQVSADTIYRYLGYTPWSEPNWAQNCIQG